MTPWSFPPHLLHYILMNLLCHIKNIKILLVQKLEIKVLITCFYNNEYCYFRMTFRSNRSIASVRSSVFSSNPGFDYLSKMKSQFYCLLNKFIKVPHIYRRGSRCREKMEIIRFVILGLQQLETRHLICHCQLVIREAAQPRSSKLLATQHSDRSFQKFTSSGRNGVNWIDARAGLASPR